MKLPIKTAFTLKKKGNKLIRDRYIAMESDMNTSITILHLLMQVRLGRQQYHHFHHITQHEQKTK